MVHPSTQPSKRTMHRSPEPEGADGSQASRYRNDPYGASQRVFYFEEEEALAAGAPYTCNEPPAGTLHADALWGRVTFVPYPTVEFSAPAEAFDGDDELVRVFVGQLPYFVTDMQLSWLCYTFGGANVVAYPERIMKRQPSGERLPTGCVHAYCTRRAVEAMAHGMHKRMLVDDTGVWHAQDAEQWAVLNEYIAAMKTDRSRRVANRPYDSVVVQLATSTYVPRHVAQSPRLSATAVNEVADVVPDVRPQSQQQASHPKPARYGRGYHGHGNARGSAPPAPRTMQAPYGRDAYYAPAQQHASAYGPW